MPAKTFEPTHQDFANAMSGSMLQLRSMFDEDTILELYRLGIMGFVEHQADIIAAKNAETRFLSNCLYPRSR